MLKSILSTIVIGVLLAAIGYLASKVGLAAYNRYLVQLEINKAKAQVMQLEGSNDELKQLVAQLGNKEFLTLKLKEQLNVKEPGEKVAIIKNDPQPEISQPPTVIKNYGFWPKWWDLFFK